MAASYLIRTIEGNDIRTNDVQRMGYGIDYSAYEDGSVSETPNPGFVPYVNVLRVETVQKDSNPTFGISSDGSESAQSSSDDDEGSDAPSDEQPDELDENAPPDATESDSLLERRVQEDQVEKILLDDLPDAVQATDNTELIRDAREQDSRSGAESIYTERLDELSGEEE